MGREFKGGCIKFVGWLTVLRGYGRWMAIGLYGAKVSKRFGEGLHLLLDGLGLLDRSRRVKKVDDDLIFPLTRRPNLEELSRLREEAPSIVIVEEDFKEAVRRPRSLIEALEDRLTPAELASLPRSIDIIGDIAIVELLPELNHVKKVVGGAVMKVHSHVKAVYMRGGKVQGVYRLRPLELISGEPIKETLHREHGCSYMLDVAKVYFSPRLSWEHMRVASQVKEGEVVIDMFAGVGPFSILIAKKASATVYAIDINPDAFHYLRRNIELNKVEDRVKALQGDARDLIIQKYAKVADRVIMNLPEKAYGFLEASCLALKPEGGIIHYYDFAKEPKPLEYAEDRLREGVEKAGGEVLKVTLKHKVRPVAPREWHVVVDAKVLPKR